jgi:tripeptidyl-peptidase-1
LELNVTCSSDPASAKFGQHWTPEEVIDAFRPSQETEDEVRKWLVDNGIDSKRLTVSENKSWFAFYATAEEAENLLYTEYHEYEDSVTGGIIPSCDEYHIPKHVREHVDYISPGIKLLAPPQSHKSKREAFRVKDETKGLVIRDRHGELRIQAESHPDPDDLSTCDIAITPACVAALYKIPPTDHKKKPNPKNSMGIFESELQFYYQPDLDLFFTNYTKFIPNGTHPVAANIDGGQQATTTASEAGGEAELDLLLAYPIIYPQTITDYEVDDLLVQANPNDTYNFGFNTFLDALDGVS